jgi:hypothetical protein
MSSSLLSRNFTGVSSLPLTVFFLCCVTLFRQGRKYDIDSDDVRNASRVVEQVADL